MWWSSLLAGNWIDGGEALIFGEGKAGAVYSWKGRQLGEKRLYIAPEGVVDFVFFDFSGPVTLGGGLAFTRQKYGGLISHKPRY